MILSGVLLHRELRHIVCHRIHHILTGTLGGNHIARDSHHHAVVGNRLRHHAVRANGRVAAEGDAADDLAAGAQVDVVHDNGGAGIFSAIGGADGHFLIDIAVAADLCLGIDDDAAKVPDVEPGADVGVVRNADAVLVLVVVQQKAGDRVEGQQERAPALQVFCRAHEKRVPEAGDAHYSFQERGNTVFAAVSEKI